MILEEYQEEDEGTLAPQEDENPVVFLVPLSAKDEERLRVYANQILEFLERESEDENITLRKITRTLQIGREAMGERLVFLASSVVELKDGLRKFLSSDADRSAFFYHNQVRGSEESGSQALVEGEAGRAFLDVVIRNRDMEKLARLWVDGLEFDWTVLYGENLPGPLSLPTYPFGGERYWVRSNATQSPLNGASSRRDGFRSRTGPRASLHPLLGANTSNLREQKFTTRFSGEEFFLDDHRVNGRKFLPGAAYLEMARAAGELAAEQKVGRISDVVWSRPIAVSDSPREVQIRLFPTEAAVEYEVRSMDDESVEGELCSQGRLFFEKQEDPESRGQVFALEQIKAGCAEIIEPQEVYKRFENMGLAYGPSFKTIESLARNGNEALSSLVLPPEAKASYGENSFYLHPSLLDGALQTVVALLWGTERIEAEAGGVYLPFALGELEIHGTPDPNPYVYVREASAGEKKQNVRKFDVFILNHEGRALVVLKNFSLRSIKDPSRANPPRVRENTAVFFEKIWEERELSSETAEERFKSPLLLFDLDDNLKKYLLARTKSAEPDDGSSVILVSPGVDFRRVDSTSFTIDPGNPSHYTKLLNYFDLIPERILYAWSWRENSLKKNPKNSENLKVLLERGLYSFYHFSQALLERRPPGGVQLLYLYGKSSGYESCFSAALSGFVKTIYQEKPEFLFGILALESDDESGKLPETSLIADKLLKEFQRGEEHEFEVIYSGQKRLVSRFKDISPEFSGPLLDERDLLKKNGVYLISGGAGGLGLVFAEYLTKSYGARLVLTGRSPLGGDKARRINELKAMGAQIDYFQVDVANPLETERLIQDIKSRHGELNGVIHGAGVLRDAYLNMKTLTQVEEVLAPKITGALNLDRATKDERLDFFVFFSSLAASIGNAGQSDYAYANSFMDNFAIYRENRRKAHKRSGKTLSINWPLWKEGGMGLDAESEKLLAAVMGMTPMSTVTGINAFLKSLRYEGAGLIVAQGVPARISAKLAPLRPVRGGAEKKTQNFSDSTARLIQKVQTDGLEIIGKILHLPADRMEADEKMSDFGFDSITFTEFSNRLNAKYSLDLTPAVFFELHTLDELVRHLLDKFPENIQNYYQEFLEGEKAEAKERDFPREKIITNPHQRFSIPQVRVEGAGPVKDRRKKEAIAIVGMAGVLPGSKDLESFWRNLESGRDLVGEVQPGRPGWEQSEGPVRQGGFIEGVDRFDAMFFGISPREAELMDPQQRLFLEVVWKTIEDAGIRPSDLSGSKTGLFVGVSTSDYQQLCAIHNHTSEAHGPTGAAHCMAPNRLSYLLNLKGPSEPVDTACSSSLVALHRAIESLRSGESEAAIVGGVNLILTPDLSQAFVRAGMLSPEGRCKTFDKSANGYVRGEGVGAVFIKPLGRAISDGNQIYALIKGSAVNHGGNAASLTAPNARAQADLLINAYEQAGFDPATLGYIETHGTGTSLGDPVEINGLKKAFAALYKNWEHPVARQAHIGLGAVKTNTGHLEAAAGMAGLLKALLAMKHKTLPGNLHLKELNPYIQLEESPFYIVRETRPWERLKNQDGQTLPRRAGVSSFGFGGVNAHVVLEEYDGPLDSKARENGNEKRPRLVLFSAKNSERLRLMVTEFMKFLESKRVHTGAINLDEIVATLQTGREVMEERLALVIEDLADLKEKLGAFLSKRTDVVGIFKGRAGQQDSNSESLLDGQEGEEFLRIIMREKKLSKLAALWTSGVNIDWNSLYPGGKPLPVSLPTYPFEKKRHWIKQNERPLDSFRDGAHSLLGEIEPALSLFDGVVYKKVFSTRDREVNEHRLEGKPVLPGVVYLEMLYAALGEFRLLDGFGKNDILEIKNFTWLAPFIVEGEQGRELCLKIQKTGDEYSIEFYNPGAGEGGMNARGVCAFKKADEFTEELLDIKEIQARTAEEIKSEIFYQTCEDTGLSYGPYFRSLEKLQGSKDEALSLLESRDEFESTYFSPALLDGALQTIGGVGAGPDENFNASPGMPYTVDSIEFIRPLKAGEKRYYSRVRSRGKDVYNVSLVDEQGRVHVKFQNLVLRTTRKAREITYYRPRWVLSSPVITTARPTPGPALIMHTDSGRKLARAIARLSDAETGETRFMELDTVKAEGEHTGLDYTPGEVYFLDIPAPDAGVEDSNILSLFRLLKGVLRPGGPGGVREIKIITCNSCDPETRGVKNPAGAILHGFIQSLSLEYPAINFALLDLAISEVREENLERLASGIKREPPLKYGPAALRGEKRYIQTLENIELPGDRKNQSGVRFKEQGVYLIAGGAGGIGRELALYLAKNYGAKLILSGRSPLDQTKEEFLDALEKAGGRGIYLQADLGERKDLAAALKIAGEKFGPVQGVIHSALVLRDRLFESMEEKDLADVLRPKVSGSINLDELLKQTPLDFILYLSSAQSFRSAPGQSNYAAACTFKDAFALSRTKAGKCSVKIINWGYWGSVGVVASPEYRERMEARGLLSINPAEGIEALERILNQEFDQILAVKGTPAALSQLSEGASFPDEGVLAQVASEIRPSHEEIARLDSWNQAHGRMENIALAELRRILRDLPTWESRVLPEYGKLLEELKSISSLKAVGESEINLEMEFAALAEQHPGLAASIRLLRECLNSLAEVLRGERTAVEVIFPHSSMELVEAIYRGNEQADFFNRLVKKSLAAFLDARRAGNGSGRKIKILEIGAGTGGTSLNLLELLNEFPSEITYTYTDISPAFLEFGEKTFGAAYPFLEFRRLDIEADPEAQGFVAGEYDFIVAANVLHATKNLRKTLAHCVRLLAPGAWLTLNEIVEKRDFATLTFGLLDGWWRFEDPEIRIPGSPLLSRGNWKKILSDQGFARTLCPGEPPQSAGSVEYGGGEARAQGAAQEIIIAEFPGRVKRNTVKPTSKPGKEHSKTDRGARNVGSVENETGVYLTELIARAAKLPLENIRGDLPLQKYGIDSLMISTLNSLLAEEFEELPKTLFFEYGTIDELVVYFLENYRELLERKFTGPSGVRQGESEDESGIEPGHIAPSIIQETIQRPIPRAISKKAEEDFQST